MIVHLVSRYMFSRQNRHRGRVIRIMVSLALSTLVMMSVLAVMDYLQSDRIEGVKAVQSFPLVASASSLEEALSIVQRHSGHSQCFIYKEDVALLDDGLSSGGVVVRYVDQDYKGGLYTTGAVAPERGIYLPYRSFSGQLFPSVTVMTLEEGQALSRVPRSRTYAVEGFFQTSLPDFDLSHVFLPLSSAPDSLEWLVAMIPVDISEEELALMLESEGVSFSLWSDRESTLYSALALERTIMTVLLASLYLIVLVQIIQSALMLARTKKRESVCLNLIGMTRFRTGFIFGLVGLSISLLASLLGLVLSLVALRIIPIVVSAPEGALFHLDWTSFLFLSILMAVLSFISYALAFRSTCTPEGRLEVLNAV